VPRDFLELKQDDSLENRATAHTPLDMKAECVLFAIGMGATSIPVRGQAEDLALFLESLAQKIRDLGGAMTLVLGASHESEIPF
jgi:hypothetical protein